MPVGRQVVAKGRRSALQSRHAEVASVRTVQELVQISRAPHSRFQCNAIYDLGCGARWVATVGHAPRAGARLADTFASARREWREITASCSMRAKTARTAATRATARSACSGAGAGGAIAPAGTRASRGAATCTSGTRASGRQIRHRSRHRSQRRSQR